jgi:SOS-response transcriptional repressor LexA
MRISRSKTIQLKPEWASTISKLRGRLNLSQTDFGRQLHTSAMAISRWERGAQEPTAEGYIALGNLAGDPLCWNFWDRAGLGRDEFMRALPSLRNRLVDTNVHQIDIASAGSGKKKKVSKSEHIAVPLLKVVAAAHGGKGDVSGLHDAPTEGVIAAPKEWCPNPTTTTCLRVKGDSMAPVICDGYIIAVDSSQNDRTQLHGKIVIAWNKEKGLTVSRFNRFDNAEVLQPENNAYESIVLNNGGKWKIIAKVLWWVGKQS